ncbi:MAG: hypothetical protein MMC33_009344 [Icmadophila ericetorum]|nr:hypothetical protein [Icmadophila ericetorum]
MFFLGVCTCAASIFRVNAVYVAYPSLNTEQDPTYDGISLLLTSALEPTLGIICACLPIIYPFLTSHCSLSRLNSPPASPSAKAPLLPITSTESNYAIKSTTSQLHPPQKPSTKKPFTKKPATREFYHSPSPMPLISLTRKPSNHPLNQNPSPKGTKALKEPEPAHFHVHTQALTLSQPCSTFRTRDLFRPFIREQGRPSGLTNEICRGSTAPVGSVVGVDDEGGEIRGGIVVKRSLEWRESMGEGLVEVNHSEARTRRGLWEDVALAR